MPGKSKKGGGLTVKKSALYKKQKFGEAISPFMMKGWSPFTKASPAKTDKTDADGNAIVHKGDKLTTSNWLKANTDYKAMKTGSNKEKSDALFKRYGVKFTKSGKGSEGHIWKDPKGKTPSSYEADFLKPS